MMNDNKMSTKTIFGSVNQRRENIRYEFKSRNGKNLRSYITPLMAYGRLMVGMGWGGIGPSSLVMTPLVTLFLIMNMIKWPQLIWRDDTNSHYYALSNNIAFTTLTFIDNLVQVPYLTFVIFRAMCPFAFLVELTLC